MSWLGNSIKVKNHPKKWFLWSLLLSFYLSLLGFPSVPKKLLKIWQTQLKPNVYKSACVTSLPLDACLQRLVPCPRSYPILSQHCRLSLAEIFLTASKSFFVDFLCLLWNSFTKLIISIWWNIDTELGLFFSSMNYTLLKLIVKIIFGVTLYFF